MGINIMGYGPKTAALASQGITLASGQSYVFPAGQYKVSPGNYSFLQWLDPITQIWRGMPADNTLVSADGYNYRITNPTGTVVGASVTTASSGLTNGIYPAGTALGTAASPSCTFAAGGGTVLAQGTVIVGGACNTTVAITSGGANYTIAPVLVVSPPPTGGVPATATCTISAGAINAVTLTNVGAGYAVAPTITVVRNPLDTTGGGAVLTVNPTLAGSGGVTAITVPINGAGMTTVPAITFSPSGPAATAIMCFTITTGVAQTSASNLGTGNIGFSGGVLATAQSVNTNPAITTGLYQPRVAVTPFNTTAGGGITFVDSGLHQTIPAGIAYASLSNGTISAAATAVAQTCGGVSDTSFVVPV